jgi:hypothetical protein
MLAYLVPNPNHPFLGSLTREWFLPERPDAYPEFTSSFSLVALFVILLAGRLGGLPRFWVWFTACFASLSVGPFLHVAGVNTFIVGPWALLRYVPVIGLARSPSRFSVVAMLGLCLLFAHALATLRSRLGRSWSWMAPAIAIALAVELIPAPRPLHAAGLLEADRRIAEWPGEVRRVLELPAGLRDGTYSAGDLSPAMQFRQTQHGKPVIGGYLSRISGKRRRQKLEIPVMAALFALSEGRELPDELERRAWQTRDAFLRRSCIGFVVMDVPRTPPRLREFAVKFFELSLLVGGDRELYLPQRMPPCGAAALTATRYPP